MDVVTDSDVKVKSEVTTVATASNNNNNNSAGDTNSKEAEMWVLQRQIRAAMVKHHLNTISTTPSTNTTTPNNNNNTNTNTIHLPISLGPTNYATELVAYRNFYRTRKQLRRDIKAWEKEERRRRLEQEDKRKKKALEYHKAILVHREDFFRFHKNKRSGALLRCVIACMICNLMQC